MTDAATSDVKQRILVAARKLFARHGFEGTSVRQICEEAGANVALVSYHFGGKEKVFEEVLRTFLPFGRLKEIIHLQSDPAEGVRRLIRGVLELGYTDPEIKSMIHVEITMRSPRLPLVQEIVLPFWNSLRQLLDKGRKMGQFQFVSLDQTLMLVMGTLLIHTKAHYFEPIIEEHPFDFEELVSETCRFVFRGLRYEEETPTV